MEVINQLESYLRTAQSWINQNFYHYAIQMYPSSTMSDFLDSLTLKQVERLRIRRSWGSIEPDALYDPDGHTLKVHLRRANVRSENENVALLVHELVEGYGYRIRLFSGIGFGMVRPEHDYAEYVETFFREEKGLPECKCALSQDTWDRIEKMDQFYRRFPEWKRYLGDELDRMFRKDSSVPIDETLQSIVIAACPTW